MRKYFIFNPKAGEDTNRTNILNRIKPLINDRDTFIYYTKGHRDATRFVEETIRLNKDNKLLFIACGGDGTMNEVFTPCVNKDNVYVSLLPCGSGNDFIKCFKHNDIDTILTLDENNVKKIDVLKVNDYYSFNMVNFGFDTTVAVQVQKDREKRGKGSNLAYVKGVIMALFKSMHYQGTITADGTVLNPDGEFMLCTCANGQYVGGMFKCSPKAKLDDGLIDVCIVRPVSRLKFIQLVGVYAKGEHLTNPKLEKYITYTRCTEVEINTSKDFAYSLDGEIIYGEHLSIKLMKNALNILTK